MKISSIILVALSMVFAIACSESRTANWNSEGLYFNSSGMARVKKGVPTKEESDAAAVQLQARLIQRYGLGTHGVSDEVESVVLVFLVNAVEVGSWKSRVVVVESRDHSAGKALNGGQEPFYVGGLEYAIWLSDNTEQGSEHIHIARK